jgi:hypothetical protein
MALSLRYDRRKKCRFVNRDKKVDENFKKQIKRRLTMKRTVSISKVILAALFVVAIFFSVYSNPALANPPEDVKLQIIEADGPVLAVKITHPTDNPLVDFIKSVEISINGSSFATYTYNRQPRKRSTFTYIYEVPLEKGYIIEVTVDSSSYGSKSAKIVVP